MSKKVVEQHWHIVCGSVEIEELLKYSKIRQWHPRNDRHSLFLAIKYPDTDFYKGSWGPELLHFSDEGTLRGKVGKVFCSYDRYTHIARWFLTSMFPP